MQRHIHITSDSYIRPYPPFQLNSRTEDTYSSIYILNRVGYGDQVLLVMRAQAHSVLHTMLYLSLFSVLFLQSVYI